VHTRRLIRLIVADLGVHALPRDTRENPEMRNSSPGGPATRWPRQWIRVPKRLRSKGRSLDFPIPRPPFNSLCSSFPPSLSLSLSLSLFSSRVFSPARTGRLEGSLFLSPPSPPRPLKELTSGLCREEPLCREWAFERRANTLNPPAHCRARLSDLPNTTPRSGALIALVRAREKEREREREREREL